jgi:voltage-gated potassium channel
MNREQTVLTVITLLLGKVTRSQVIAVAAIGVVSVVVGGVVFAIVDHRSIGIGLYWAVTTATTVGYGDVVPENAAGRVVAVAVMLTAIPAFGAAFALFAAAMTATRLNKLLHMEHHLPPGRYVVLLGIHPTVPLVARQLRDAGYLVVLAADVESSTIPKHVHHVPGSPTDEEVVRSTKPADAEAVLIVGPDDGEMLVTAVVLRHVAPDVPVVAVTQSTMVAHALVDLGIERTISTEELVGHTLAKSLETPHAAQVLLRLIDGDGYKLEELPVDPSFIGTPLRTVRGAIDGLLLGVVRDGTVTLGIRENPVLMAGDKLVRVAAE